MPVETEPVPDGVLPYKLPVNITVEPVNKIDLFQFGDDLFGNIRPQGESDLPVHITEFRHWFCRYIVDHLQQSMPGSGSSANLQTVVETAYRGNGPGIGCGPEFIDTGVEIFPCPNSHFDAYNGEHS